MGALVIPELVEAASRTGNVELLAAARDWMALRAKATPTPWALGIDARIGALLADGDAAESLYRESLEHLGRTQVGLSVPADISSTASGCGARIGASTHAPNCGWPRRCSRPWAPTRSPTGLAASCWPPANRPGSAPPLPASGVDLTPQELQVARLAQEGLSNNEIGGQLFISPRTVQYHLRKVFAKLGIRSRSELAHVLPASASRLEPSA